MRKRCRGWKIPETEYQHTPTLDTHITRNSIHAARSFLKYFKEIVAHHGRSVTGELQSVGRARMAVVGLVQQAVDVGGQTGCGADGVVPQDVDHLVESVQTVLHLRLQTPGDKRFKLHFLGGVWQLGQSL